MTQRKQSPPRGLLKHRAVLPSIVAVGVVALLLAADAAAQRLYEDKVLPGVHIGAVELGGLSYVDAEQLIQQAVDQVQTAGMTLTYESTSVPLDLTVAANDLGVAADIVTYDVTATIDAVYGIGHHHAWLRDTWDRIRVLVLRQTELKPVYSMDDDLLEDAVHDALETYETAVVEPAYILSSNGSVGVTEGSSGRMFDMEFIRREIVERVSSLSIDPIAVTLEDVEPSVSDAAAETFVDEVAEIVGAGSLTLRAGDKEVTVKPSTYIAWFTADTHGAVSLSVSEDVLVEYLENLGPQVNIAPENARFYIDNGTVKELNASSNGSELDSAAAILAITDELPKGDLDITLPMRSVEALAGADTAANLGIKELVGTGTTSFTGSPANRQHNIKVGADLLNGLLIAPGEEFSTITAVGPVDATSGYLQELVIKGNKTIPEFGGGLCQIGTTVFRAVMSAGLPVLERQNHSYRVSYYEPPTGMDATIYEPKPDLRFRNDYNGYLLIQARVEGMSLIVEFWGTEDGRVATTTTPRVYNYVSPPEQKTIETTEIPVGTTKCTEKAHTGADAEFTYTVTHADGTVESETFKSHYRPWQAVCLVGVKEVSSDDDGTKTNTNTNTNTSKNTNTNTNVNTNTNSNTNTSTSDTTNSNENTNTNT